MIIKSRLSISLSKLLVSLIALLILNYSVDTPDPLAYTLPNGKENLSKNDIESVYEYVTECMMDLDDFVPETDDGDETKVSKKAFDWLVTNLFIELPHNTHYTCNTFADAYIGVFPAVSVGSVDPPPDGNLVYHSKR